MTETVFKLENPARMRSFRVMRQANEARGPDGDPELVTVVELGFDVEAGVDEESQRAFDAAVEHLLPGAVDAVDRVWSASGGGDGFDMTARKHIEELNLKISASRGGSVLFDVAIATVKSRAKLVVDKEGKAVLQLRRVVGRFTKDQMETMASLVECDVFVVAAHAQVNMSEIKTAEAEVVDEQPKKKRGRPKKTMIREAPKTDPVPAKAEPKSVFEDDVEMLS